MRKTNSNKVVGYNYKAPVPSWTLKDIIKVVNIGYWYIIGRRTISDISDIAAIYRGPKIIKKFIFKNINIQCVLGVNY
jgi:hypothetical protein